MLYRKICEQIEKLEPEIVKTLCDLIRIPAIAPENGGEGEYVKAEKLQNILRENGFDNIQQYDAVDKRVKSKKRPNLIVEYGSNLNYERLWIVSHLDVVPSGDKKFWNTPPFSPIVRDGKIFGRGSEDNGQSIVASIFALKALIQLGVTPQRPISLAFVADEEQGSNFGIHYIIKKQIFKKNDLVLVPDFGNTVGDFIEIAEKSILWFKLSTFGKQSHASDPTTGLNPHRIGMNLALSLDKLLHDKYVALDPKFNVPFSTFEPTKKEKNVDAVNIIPAEDTVYFDCRILPSYDPKNVLADVKRCIYDYANKYGVVVDFKILQNQPASEINPKDCKLTELLRKSIRLCRGFNAKEGGIGGGTCAGIFRKFGIPAVVWSTLCNNAHQPNEYALIKNIVEDAKVFAMLMIV